jgi:hypothetical protein
VLNVISGVLLRKLIDPSFSSSHHNSPLALFSTRKSRGRGQTAMVAMVEMTKKAGALVVGRKPLTYIWFGSPRYCTHIYITTPIVSALKNYYA